MQINLKYGAWMKVARTLAGHASLTIQYVDEDRIKEVGAQAWTSGQRVYLREPCVTWSEEQFKLWLYFLMHEIGHCTPSRIACFDVLKNKEPSGFLAYIYNVLEDHVQEHVLFDQQPVLRKFLGEGRAQFYAFMMGNRSDEQREAMIKTPQAPTLFSWDAGLRTFMKPLLGWDHHLIAEYRSDARVQEWTAKLQDGDYADVLRNKPDPWALFELAERILVEVFEEDPAQQQQQEGKGDGEEQEGEAQQGNQRGKGEPGDDEGKGAAESAGKGKPADGEGKPSSAEGNVDYNDLLGHDHSKDERAGGNSTERGGGLNIDYDEYFKNPAHSRTFIPNYDNLYVYDVAKGEYPSQDNRISNQPVQSSTLTKRIGRYMQAKSKNRRVHNQKQGKLSNKNLFRLRVKGIGQARERVFHKRILNTSKDVAVTVAVDMSGSMEGHGKSYAAIASVVHLHEVLTKQLRIPLEILGFSAGAGNGIHVVIQSFDKPRGNTQVENDMRRILPFCGANRDGEFLMWARHRLLTKTAARHIMIVLSDGQPRSPGCGDVAKFTKDVISEIQSDGRVELHGIGILSQSVRQFYDSCDVIDDVTQLEPKLLTVLKNKIINHL